MPTPSNFADYPSFRAGNRPDRLRRPVEHRGNNRAESTIRCRNEFLCVFSLTPVTFERFSEGKTWRGETWKCGRKFICRWGKHSSEANFFRSSGKNGGDRGKTPERKVSSLPELPKGSKTPSGTSKTVRSESECSLGSCSTRPSTCSSIKIIVTDETEGTSSVPEEMPATTGSESGIGSPSEEYEDDFEDSEPEPAKDAAAVPPAGRKTLGSATWRVWGPRGSPPDFRGGVGGGGQKTDSWKLKKSQRQSCLTKSYLIGRFSLMT